MKSSVGVIWVNVKNKVILEPALSPKRYFEAYRVLTYGQIEDFQRAKENGEDIDLPLRNNRREKWALLINCFMLQLRLYF